MALPFALSSLIAPVHAADSGPATANVDASLDLSAPEYRTISKNYASARKVSDDTRREALKAILAKRIEESELMLSEKRKTRNVTGIAVATTAINMFQTAMTNLDLSGAFSLPASVRKELETTLSQVKDAAKPIEATFSNEISRLEAEVLKQFISAVKGGHPELSDQAVESRYSKEFRSLLTAPVPSPAPAPAASTNTLPSASGSTNANVSATNQPPPDIIAASGEGQEWITAGRWIGAMRGMDVISIPVMQAAGTTNRTEQFNSMSGRNSELEYASVLSLPPKPELVYRLKNVKGHIPVGVLEWPSAHNGHQLMIRTTPSERFPSMHGFELQVSVATGDVRRILSAGQPSNAASDNTPRALLSLVTTPSGASIVVDGKPLTVAVTPCKLKLTLGSHSIRFSLPGYQDILAANLDVRSNQTFQGTFKADPRFARKTVSVPANAAKWTSSGISVSRGDTLVVYAEGTWSCTAEHEAIGPAGYPKDQKYMRYYGDPMQYIRQSTEIDYGALLMRIGDSAPYYAVGSQFKISITAPGSIWFDVNEIQNARFRKDNNGALTVTVIVMPPGTAPKP